MANIEENTSYEEACKTRDNLVPAIKWPANLLRWDNQRIDEKARCDIIAYEKGGVYTSIIRKKLIIENNVWFPEKMRFEDNYWGSLIMAYIDKIAFVPSIEYFYRLRASSTVHEKEGIQYLERVKIEKKLLEEEKRRELYEKYYTAWEYIYAFRYGHNTIGLLINRFDDLPVNDIRTIQRDLDNEFPKWKRNCYWNERMRLIRRWLAYLEMYCPRGYVMVKKVLRRKI